MQPTYGYAIIDKKTGKIKSVSLDGQFDIFKSEKDAQFWVNRLLGDTIKKVKIVMEV